MHEWTLSRVGDSAIVVEFQQQIDPALNARALAVAEAMRRANHDGVLDIIEGFCSVAVEFDPLRTDVRRVAHDLESAAQGERAAEGPGRELTLSVCYGGSFGPDLGDVARFARCSEAEVVATHTGTSYRVYMLGFLPGFAYMATVAPQIAMPRRQRPRLRVPAGSVGIAERQTGVYPVDAPGGWQLIGRCSARPFDLERDEPFLLRGGDIVRFVAVSEEEFRQASSP